LFSYFGGDKEALLIMVHPDTELRFVNARIGYGVFATRLIPCGTITWVRDDLDQLFSLDAVNRMSQFVRPFLDKYSYVNGAGQFVLCWDHARYINHSCEPSCLSPGLDFELAVRDIQPDEELTDDYGALNLSEPFECACGLTRCRGSVGCDDLLKYAAQWDATVAPAFARIPAVDQPLWPLVAEKAAVEQILGGRESVPSCLQHYWPPQSVEGYRHLRVLENE
jgi:hypothetical protein